jgi:hypothetical protein
MLSEHNATFLRITSCFFCPSKSRCACFDIRRDPEAQFQEHQVLPTVGSRLLSPNTTSLCYGMLDCGS